MNTGPFSLGLMPKFEVEPPHALDDLDTQRNSEDAMFGTLIRKGLIASALAFGVVGAANAATFPTSGTSTSGGSFGIDKDVGVVSPSKNDLAGFDATAGGGAGIAVGAFETTNAGTLFIELDTNPPPFGSPVLAGTYEGEIWLIDTTANEYVSLVATSTGPQGSDPNVFNFVVSNLAAGTYAYIVRAASGLVTGSTALVGIDNQQFVVPLPAAALMFLVGLVGLRAKRGRDNGLALAA